MTLERAVIVDLPWLNDEGRLVVDLTALPGARVVGEHLHPAQVESFSVQDGELTMLRDGRKSVLRAGEAGEDRAGRLARLVERGRRGRDRARGDHAG